MKDPVRNRESSYPSSTTPSLRFSSIFLLKSTLFLLLL
uniref:Uncharacterized protein n=1 Tax=Lepeophtheirus salmonis TaxID=72036 RepID=A0A0K2VIS5_LEPSM